MAADQQKYSYEDAGFNSFFRRTLASTPMESHLKNVGTNRAYKPLEINFDSRQTSGSMGDITRIGTAIELNGPGERISIIDREGNEVTRVGNMDS